MIIANKKFLFKLSKNTVDNQDTFINNEDNKINNQREFISISEKEVSVYLDICKEEYESFIEYLYVDLSKSKNYFYIELDFEGEYRDYLVDIISNISVSFTNNKFSIRFKLAIIN